jgi:hypothetical protein
MRTNKCADSQEAMHQHGKKNGFIYINALKNEHLTNNQESCKGFDSL